MIGYFIAGVAVTVFLGFIFKKYKESEDRKNSGGGGSSGNDTTSNPN
jgi:hypothetical protein